jgi:Bacterial Ig-like domain (group 2)
MLRSSAHWPLLVIAMVAAVSCHPDAVQSLGGDATLVTRADLSGTSVATVVVEVTAPDIATPLDFNLTVVNHIASGTITVPAGSNRTFSMRAFDAGGVETHSGSATLSVQPGTNATISIVLHSLTGDEPIVATLGSFTITVAPTDTTLVVGDTARVAAAITDWDGNPAAGPPSWATHDPSVAIVDAGGLVTAIGSGATTITATYGGAAATATVTVTP